MVIYILTEGVEELKDWNLKKFKKNVDVCPNCKAITRIRNDPYHAEIICEHCGAIIKDKLTPIEMPDIQVTDEELLIELNRYTFEKSDGWIKTYRKKKSKFKKMPGIEDYCNQHKDEIYHYKRLKEYKETMEIINSNFMMTPYQKERIMFILGQIKKVKNLCSKCSTLEIISSISVYVMRRDKRRIDLNRNPFLKEVGLTEHKHMLIMERLMEIREKNSSL